MTTLPKITLNSGEVSPRAYSRVDLDKYLSSLATCKNMIPLSHGPVIRRPGFEYIADAGSTSEVEVIPFEFSVTQAYIIEAYPYHFRFYKDGGQIQTPDSYTKLLLNFEGYEGTVTFTDESATGHTVTPSGNAKITTDQYKLGTSSGAFDGTGDYLSVADHADWYMGTGKFTIDFWVKFNTAEGIHGIFGQYVDGDNVLWMTYSGPSPYRFSFVVWDGGVGTISFNTSGLEAEDDTWYHVALIRGWGGDSNSWAITINGTAYGTLTDSSPWPDLASSLFVGKLTNVIAQNYYLDGYLDGFRVSKGVARWTADFSATLPTSPYPNSGSGGGGSAYSISTPYRGEDLSTLQWVQSADTMYLTHPNYSPRKLTRTDHDSWSLSVISFTAKPSAWGVQSKGITGITQANPGVVTCVGHGLSNDDIVLITNVGGMTEVNGYLFTVANKADDTFQLSGVNTTNFTEYTSGGYWNQYNKNPATATFYEERLIFAGAPDSPQTIDASQAGDYEDMTTGTDDEDGYQFTIASDQVNVIRWLAPSRRLLIGTVGGEWWMSGGGSDDAITPSNVKVRQDSGLGSNNIRPVSIGNKHLFLQRPGKTIRLLEYSYDDDSYTGNDLSILAEHLTKDYGIVRMALQKVPDQCLWCVRSDGALLGLTFLPEHEVIGWHRHDTGASGLFKSVASIPGTSKTEVWAVVERTIDDSTVKYIERMYDYVVSETASDFVHVDSFLSYNGSPVVSLSGLDHLDGEEVAIWADGAGLENQTVSGGIVRPYGTSGTLVLEDIVGTFQDNEIIYEASYGSELITDSDDRNFTGGDIGNWIVEKDGSGTCAYSADDLDGTDDKQALITSNSDTYLYGKLRTEYLEALTTGEFCIWTFNGYIPSGNTQKTVQYKPNNIGVAGSPKYTDFTGSEDGYVGLTNIFQVSADNGELMWGFWTGSQPSDGDKFYTDDHSLKQITNAALVNGTLSGDELGYDSLRGSFSVGANLVGASSGATATVVTGSDNTTSSIVHVGLPFNSDVETLKLDPGDAGFQGKIKRITELILRLYQTAGTIQYGRNSSNLDSFSLTSLTTGDKEKLFEGLYETDGQVFIRKSDAGPMTIQALLPIFEVYNR